MSLPSFPPSSDSPSSSPILVAVPGAGAGNHLPVWLLALCGAFTAVATIVSVMSITLQLKNYRKPMLQRAVVRIMVMVPLYAISSLIALFSLEAAFFIDAVRDLYEAFVIYTFFQLLITYLGGERSLLIILHGRPPIPHPFPVNLFLKPMDVSDPWTLLNLKRGVLQYVQVKPLLVVATVILKATGTYQEGRFAADSGYTYISLVYNASICLSLYCLAMFWVCVSDDLKPFRPVPKFLCVKGILFFSFWQSIGISLLVAMKAIKKVGPYTDAEHMSLALVDSLICFEMPIFAIAHQYAFQASDYIDNTLIYAARLPFIYALRDAFGLKDVWQDTKDTIKGRGVSYQAYEPAEGGLHHGAGRQKRIRAGLRYSKGGKSKYWIPIPGNEARNRGERGPLSSLKRRVDERLAAREGYAPLLPKQAANIVHDDPDDPDLIHQTEWTGMFDSDSEESDAASLDFESVNEEEDQLYERARRIGYAGFPNVDVSKEAKRRKQWEEENGILAGKWVRGGRNEGDGLDTPGRKNGRKGKGKGKGKKGVYGAWADRASIKSQTPSIRSVSNGHFKKPKDGPPADSEGQYDGDNERADASQLTNGTNQGIAPLQWTKKQLRKIQSTKVVESVTSPFTLGDDPDDDPTDSNARPKLPSDAVDLVVEDPKAVDAARARERRKGEPQTNAPAQVLWHERDDQNRPAHLVEEVYSPVADADRRHSESLEPGTEPNPSPMDQLEQIEERLQDPSPPISLTSPYHDPGENPWA
ncbi:organic solute transporter Ostalpha-domain-containing protein [Naematelia encephala]|uniref:Organic solute transporter Ostalpha-domain-containing protein n=1 Tax=Naematelia encephala TaxID=71784 RepID=A0A1Y2B024_9TREE|nr:organic solute transporter Ostalpha-domain-containing protein [Naematelia encephala]